MKKFTYTLVYVVLMGLPAGLFSAFAFESINVKALLIVTLVGLFIGGIFDIWAVRQGKKDKFYIWEYSLKSTLGIKLFGVPIEDFFLFLVLTPILIISVWESSKKILERVNYSLTAILVSGSIFIIAVYFLTYRIAIAKKKKRGK